MNQASSVSSPSISLKRTRPTVFAIGRGPALPKITSEIILQVYTHVSLRRLSGKPEEYGDNERLVELGKTALYAAVTYALFNERPILKIHELYSQREYVLSDTNITGWVTMYGMQDRVRCHPEVLSVLDTPKEARSIFYAYVGGVYTDHGMDIVQEWISQLLGQDHERLSQPTATETPPTKKIKSEEGVSLNQPSTIFFASQPPPSPVRHPPPHLQSPPVLPNPLAPAQPGLPFLPLFNQAAAQRRVTVEYPAEFSGPSHAGLWTVRCVVNGIPKGVGSGGSKQVAKEEAARQAYYAMGWT